MMSNNEYHEIYYQIKDYDDNQLRVYIQDQCSYYLEDHFTPRARPYATEEPSLSRKPLPETEDSSSPKSRPNPSLSIKTIIKTIYSGILSFFLVINQ